MKLAPPQRHRRHAATAASLRQLDAIDVQFTFIYLKQISYKYE